MWGEIVKLKGPESKKLNAHFSEVTSKEMLVAKNKSELQFSLQKGIWGNFFAIQGRVAYRIGLFLAILALRGQGKPVGVMVGDAHNKWDINGI